MLSDIKAYLQEQPATIGDLSVHFRVSPDAMRGMLDHWIRKGKVAREPTAPKCSCCAACHEQDTEIYRWTASNGR